MQTALNLTDAVAVYFETKNLMLADTLGLQIFDAGPLKCLHNHPRWSEVDAFYGLDVTPAEAVEAIRNYGPNPNHRITAFTASPDSLKDAYLELGYQLLPWEEPLMLKPLSGRCDADKSNRVQTCQTPTTRDYWIEEDDQPVCWGRSIMTSARVVYISSMRTLPEYRRRGLASAILQRIYNDALAEGAEWIILCSTPMGLPLYQANGYEVLAYMQAFEPIKEST